jgi:hypothetical protein
MVETTNQLSVSIYMRFFSASFDDQWVMSRIGNLTRKSGMKLPAMSKFGVVICPEQRRKRINLSHIAQFKHTRI